MGGARYNGRSALQWEHLHVLILHELSEDVVQLLSHRLELEKVTEHHHLRMLWGDRGENIVRTKTTRNE